MSDIPYQSPWRNSIVMAPSGRKIGLDYANTKMKSVSTTSPQRNFSSHPMSPPGPLAPDRDMMDGLVEVALQAIAIPEADEEQENVQITDCTYIGSYNWMKRESPTILVPGSPPQWLNRSPPYTIPPDVGIQFVDQNGYRIPHAVLLPLVAAVNKTAAMNGRDPFDWTSADFVTDRNSLRKLMRWVGGGDVRDFRIDVQLAGRKTILLNRWEKRNREVFSGRTYGFSFEKASTETAPGCRESTGHHRIVTYDLNGLKMVVRFEVDACIPPPAKYPRKSVSDMDDLVKSFNAISVLPNALGSNSNSNQHLTVLEGGLEVSPTAVVELTTRSQTTMKLHGFDWKEAYPQLFFSQTAHHILAIHNRGRFVEVQKRKLLSEELQAVEKDAQCELKKMRKALDLIKDVIIGHGKTGRLSLVCVHGEMKVYQRSKDESCLPEFAMRLFETPE
ncbi:hypothetical protein B0H34DRAFT_789326 [Crassisporium funariophilum]|nr:hypothetical protein B0H34DRAFT_789326 [Crassisporium funariophilum]